MCSSDLILARTLAWVMRTVAGRDYAPRQVSLDPLARWMRPGAQGARTLHGCVVAAHRGGFLVCREPRNLPVSPLISGTSAAWDGRFLVALEGGNPAVRYTVEPLGARGWQAIRKPTRHVVPYRAAQSAPALVAEGAVLAVPHLGVETPGVAFSVSPLSAKTLALTPFAVVSGPG